MEWGDGQKEKGDLTTKMACIIKRKSPKREFMDKRRAVCLKTEEEEVEIEELMH